MYFFPTMKETKDNTFEFFDDPKLDRLAYLTFAGKEDENMNFSFIIDMKQREQNNEPEQKAFQGEDQFNDGIAVEQFSDINRQCLFLFSKKNVREKNQNLHKTIIRIFLNNFQEFAKEEQFSPSYYMFMGKIIKQIQEIGNENLVLSHLKMLFGEGREQKAEENYQKMNRYILHKIFSSKTIMEREVVKSNYFKPKNILKNLIGMKIYKFRVKKPRLTGRTQSH